MILFVFIDAIFLLFLQHLQEGGDHRQRKRHVVLFVALASGLVKWKATLLGKWKDSVMKTG